VILGFTGTRKGMTPEQKKTVGIFLRSNTVTKHFNGACEGADRDMYFLVLSNSNANIVFYPGDKEQYVWALIQQSEVDDVAVVPRRPYMVRNELIVTQSDCLVATPYEDHEVKRSGTWATVRIARRQGKPVTIVWPDGTATGDINGRHQNINRTDHDRR